MSLGGLCSHIKKTAPESAVLNHHCFQTGILNKKGIAVYYLFCGSYNLVAAMQASKLEGKCGGQLEKDMLNSSQGTPSLPVNQRLKSRLNES